MLEGCRSPLSVIRAEHVKGTGMRALAEQQMRGASVPERVREQILAGISDASLKDGFTAASGVELLPVAAGRGGDPVELSVHSWIDDDSSRAAKGKVSEGEVDDKASSSSGKFGKAEHEMSGVKRKDGGFGGRVPITSDDNLSAYGRLDLKGRAPRSTWTSTSSAQEKAAVSIEPGGGVPGADEQTLDKRITDLYGLDVVGLHQRAVAVVLDRLAMRISLSARTDEYTLDDLARRVGIVDGSLEERRAFLFALAMSFPEALDSVESLRAVLRPRCE